MTCRWTTEDELAKWADLDTLPLYQHRSWWQAVREGLGYKCVGVLNEKGGSPIFLMPYFEAKKGPFRLIGSPLRGSMTPYQRPLLVEDGVAQGRFFDLLFEQHRFLRAQGYSRIEWTFPGLEQGAEEMRARTSAALETRRTFHLRIQPALEPMWDNMKKEGRNMVRKAEKAGVTIKRCAGTGEELSLFYKMLRGTFAKSGQTPPHPLAFYEACIRHLMPIRRLLFLAAEAEGRTIAMGFFPHDATQIYYMSGASLPDVSRFAPNNLIQWEVIRFAVENGLRLYDLGGVGIPAIDKFKASVGGVLHERSSLVWKSPAGRLAEGAYMTTRWVASRARAFISR